MLRSSHKCYTNWNGKCAHQYITTFVHSLNNNKNEIQINNKQSIQELICLFHYPRQAAAAAAAMPPIRAPLATQTSLRNMNCARNEHFRISFSFSFSHKCHGMANHCQLNAAIPSHSIQFFVSLRLLLYAYVCHCKYVLRCARHRSKCNFVRSLSCLLFSSIVLAN